MDEELLFVYGSLKRCADNPMQRRLLKTADFVAEGFYQGRLYRLNGYPAAVPSDSPSDKVYGDIFQLRNAEATFKWLDAYELCIPKSWVPAEYIRNKAGIHLCQGKAISAWIYLYQRPTLGLRRIKNGNYRDIIA